MKKGICKISGSNKFSIPSTDFEISPLSSDCNLYQDKLADETVNSVKVGEIKSGEYTKVHGAIAGTIFHIDTVDEFIVVYNYE